MADHPGEMSSRERFLRTLAREPVDRPALWDEGIREDVREEWAKQGCPVDRDLDKEFSVDRRELVQPDMRNPRFFIRDHGDEEDRALDADDRARYPDDWPAQVRTYRDRDFSVGLRISRGLFLTLGVEDWRTLRPVLLALADEPRRAASLMEGAACFAAKVLERAYEEVSFDYVLLSEPIASNYAPVVGPWTFRAACEGAYRFVIAQARTRGIRWVIFQSYGNTTALVPEAMAIGCNVYWAGDVRLTRTSYADLRRRHPALGLIGGIDVDLLPRDTAAIRREVRRIVPPLVRQGAYLPLLDGRVRTYVRFDHYAAYRSALLDTVEETCASVRGQLEGSGRGDTRLPGHRTVSSS